MSGNNAAVDGGGIFNDNASTMTLTNSTVSGNTAGDDAGGIINDHGSTATLTNSTVSGNDAGDDGGGIRNFGTTNLFSSTIANNRAGLNSSPNNLGGGGVHNFGGTLTLTNSTVSGNVARTDGGGIFNETGTVASFSSTIANNRADADSNGSGIGGGVFNLSGATFNFQNTILANNQVGSNPNNIRDCAGTLTSQGYNLIRITPPGECNVAPVTGDVFSSDPLLGPLQNNGGPTQTHALLAGSPAIDAGNPSGCRDNLGALLLKDQRGLRRTVDGNRDGAARCDIGPIEFGSGVTTGVDFDGDGRSDIAVYRNGDWFIYRSSDGGVTSLGWGSAGDIPVPADYDGDGRTDIAVYRNGDWFIYRSSDGGVTSLGWGSAGDIPVPADYDGDGKTDIAVYRNGDWFIYRSSDGGVTSVRLGKRGGHTGASGL